MDGQTLVERVRDGQRVELERLGSDKALIAATDATLEPDAVLGVFVGQERQLGDAVERWADQADDGRVQEAFASAAASARDHVADLEVELTGDPPAGDGLELGDPGTVPEQVGAGFVGGSLVADRTLLQGISFFVNEADRGRADLLRTIREDVEDRLDTGADLLGECCADEGDWDRALTAAEAVVAAAYEEYATTLERMGLDPKPVC